tara:strand:+ start:507 stop:1061 length:555 start_codon:yes stop_codon:yes gene_type:complete
MISRIIATNPYDYIQEIKDFCKIAYEESNDENMSLDDGNNTPSLLKHLRLKTIPMITMVLYDKNIISLSGVQKYNEDVCILGKRFYTLKEYRKSPMGKPNNFFQDYMYKPQLSWAVDNNFKVALITFNEHNKKLIPVLEREQKKGRSFQSFKKLDKKLIINKTEQYVFYNKLDINYDVENITIR